MPLTIVCTCGQHYRVDERYAGQQHPCGVCGELILITAAPPAAPQARDPRQDYAADEEPAPRGGGGAIVALFATLLFVLVLGGGLAGVIWYLAQQQEAEQVAEEKPPLPKEKPPDRTPPDKQDDNPPPKKQDDEPPKKQEEPKKQEPAKSNLPPPSDRPWHGHAAVVLAVAADPAGKHVWTASGGLDDRDRPAADSTLRRWDAATGKENDRIELTDSGVGAAAFDASCRRAAVAVPGKTIIDVWDLASKKRLATLDGHFNPVRCLAFSGDGKRLVSGGEDRLLIVWDVSSGKALHKLQGHTNAVNAVAVANDGTRAVSGGLDHTARLWDLDRGEAQGELKGHGDIVWATAFSPDGRLALSGGGLQQVSPTVFVAGARDHAVRCWDVAKLEVKSRAEPLPVAVTALAFSPDARRYLAGGNDGKLRLWQLGSNKEAFRLEGHTARVRWVAFFANGRKAVSVAEDRTIRLWDLPADLPEMVRDLKSDKAAARKAALEEMARLGPDAKSAVPDLFDALATGDDAWKQSVRELLRSFSPLDKEHVTRLDRLLQNRSDAPGRRFAAEELGKLGEEARPAAKTLLKAVSDADLEVRQKALQALAPIIDEVGAAAFEPMLGALRDRDATLRQTAEKAIEKLGPPGVEQLDLIRRLLGEEAAPLRRFALRALGEMGRPAAPALGDVSERATKDDAAEVRQQAFEALTKIAPKDARTVTAARAGLADRTAGVARQAAKALEAAADVPGLVAALDHDDSEVSKIGDEGLRSARFTKEHLPLLTKLVESRRAASRLRGIEALGDLGPDAAEAVPVLGKSLASASDKEQVQTLEVLAKVGPAAKAAGKDVAKLLPRRDRKGKNEVCKVLIKIGAPEVKEMIRPLMEQLKPANGEEAENEEATAEREKSRRLLVQIGKPAVAPMLAAVEGEYAGGRGDAAILNGMARLAIVKAIGEMGSAAGGTQTLTVLSRLRQVKNEPFAGVREEATKAYVRVQQKE